MRYLIISDIHANWEALEAVIHHAKGRYEKVLCCGDIVGYGADPDAVTCWVRQNVAAVIRGNHDKACAGLEDLQWFNPVARISSLWTQENTQPDNIKWLRALVRGPAAIGEFQLVHGSPVDEDEYIIYDRDAASVYPYLETRISFFGHTHLQGGFQFPNKSVRRILKPEDELEEIELDVDDYYLINPGSVGQPRDSDPRAGYAIYEPEHQLVELYRVGYDVAAAQRKILDAGLPEILALRLATGN